MSGYYRMGEGDDEGIDGRGGICGREVGIEGIGPFVLNDWRWFLAVDRS